MGDLAGLPQPSHGLPLVQLLPNGFLFISVILLKIPFHEGRVHRTGTNTVDSYFFWVVDRELPGHGDNGALGRTVREPFFDPDQTGYGTDIYDVARETGGAAASRVSSSGKRPIHLRHRDDGNR